MMPAGCPRDSGVCHVPRKLRTRVLRRDRRRPARSRERRRGGRRGPAPGPARRGGAGGRAAGRAPPARRWPTPGGPPRRLGGGARPPRVPTPQYHGAPGPLPSGPGRRPRRGVPPPLPPLTARVGPGGRIVRVPDPASPRPEVLLPSPWAVRVSGSVDLRLQAPGWGPMDRVPLAHETHHALPFLAERIRTFRDAVRGDTSDFARVIRYMLTTLVQYRVVEGYAGGENGVSGTAVGDILTTAGIEQSGGADVGAPV